MISIENDSDYHQSIVVAALPTVQQQQQSISFNFNSSRRMLMSQYSILLVKILTIICVVSKITTTTNIATTVGAFRPTSVVGNPTLQLHQLEKQQSLLLFPMKKHFSLSLSSSSTYDDKSSFNVNNNTNSNNNSKNKNMNRQQFLSPLSSSKSVSESLYSSMTSGSSSSSSSKNENDINDLQSLLSSNEKINTHVNFLYNRFYEYIRTNYKDNDDDSNVNTNNERALNCIYDIYRILCLTTSTGTTTTTTSNDKNGNSTSGVTRVLRKQWIEKFDTMIYSFTEKVFDITALKNNFSTKNGRQMYYEQQQQKQLHYRRIFLGIDAIRLQLSTTKSSFSSMDRSVLGIRDFGGDIRTDTNSMMNDNTANASPAIDAADTVTSILPFPYNTIPKRTLINALNALLYIIDESVVSSSSSSSKYGTTDKHNYRNDMYYTNERIIRQQKQQQQQQQQQQSSKSYTNRAINDSSYVFQLLLTGDGVRNISRRPQSQTTTTSNRDTTTTTTGTGSSQQTVTQYEYTIDERIMNKYFQSIISIGQIDYIKYFLKLHDTITTQVTLQPILPPLSATTYSILIKGYGRYQDLYTIERILLHAITISHIVPDIILLNTIIDTYINCNVFDRAIEIFDIMRKINTDQYYVDQSTSIDDVTDSSSATIKRRYSTITTTTTSSPTAAGTRKNSIVHQWLMKNKKQDNLPKPNQRTYNTILKGYTKYHPLQDTMFLAEEMKAFNLWDPVTTNTIVHACIGSLDYKQAEMILSNYTVLNWDYTQRTDTKQTSFKQSRYHPNVGAYTELIDYYSKTNQLDKALITMQRMQQLNIRPNDVTYNCLLGGFGRENKIVPAKKTMDYMKQNNIPVTVRTYNSLISGLVKAPIPKLDISASINTDTDNSNLPSDTDTEIDLNERVDDALILLRDMIQTDIRPNDVTLSVLVSALSRCSIPRVKEISMLIDQFDKQQYVRKGNLKVATVLIQTYGQVGDVDKAISTFRHLDHVDTVAVNALLDVLSRAGNDEYVKKLFTEFYTKKEQPSEQVMKPDIMSYSILFNVLLRESTSRSMRYAQKMYYEMRRTWNMLPDRALVDYILKSIIKKWTQNMMLDEMTISFARDVLNDAERYIVWNEGQLERRQRAIQNSIRTWMKNKDQYNTISSTTTAVTRASSSTSLTTLTTSSTSTTLDDLFQRKGWNEVDSGFRFWGGGGSITSTSSSSSSRRSGTSDDVVYNDPKQISERKDGTNTSIKNIKKRKQPKDAFLESHGWNDVDSGFRIF